MWGCSNSPAGPFMSKSTGRCLRALRNKKTAYCSKENTSWWVRRMTSNSTFCWLGVYVTLLWVSVFKSVRWDQNVTDPASVTEDGEIISDSARNTASHNTPIVSILSHQWDLLRSICRHKDIVYQIECAFNYEIFPFHWIVFNAEESTFLWLSTMWGGSSYLLILNSRQLTLYFWHSAILHIIWVLWATFFKELYWPLAIGPPPTNI